MMTLSGFGSRESDVGSRKKYFTLHTSQFTILIAALLLAAGCGLSPEDAQEEGVAIPPASTGSAAELGLGPGARPLSFGPGDKGSPRVNPSGDRVAFVLDGYVAEKPLRTQEENLIRTSKDFGATGAEWLLDGNLAVLSPETRGATLTPSPVSLFAAEDGSNAGSKLTGEVEAVGAVPGGQAVVLATSEGSPDSRLVLLWGPKERERFYLSGRVKGHVTGLSVSPDGTRAVLAVRRDTGEAEVRVYRFSEERTRRVASVAEGMEVLGAPQWTQEGVYFVVGEAGAEATQNYALYRASEDSETPEPVRDVGEGFVATSIGVSPDGGRLAVVGRRNPGSPTNLYVLDLTSETLEAATANENMEIKTNPRDLAWSPDGSAVILVARGALSGPEVYDAPKEALSSAFYNLYEVPVGRG